MIYDCNSAGTIVRHFNRFAEQQQQLVCRLQCRYGMLKRCSATPAATRCRRACKRGGFCCSHSGADGSVLEQWHECLQLAACDEDELLPSVPDVPADLFTCAPARPHVAPHAAQPA